MTADVRATVADLRDQLSALAEQLGPYAPPSTPTRWERAASGGDPQREGPVWDVPPSRARPHHRCLSVRAFEQDDVPKCVYVEGCDFSLHGDWTALDPAEARSFAWPCWRRRTGRRTPTRCTSAASPDKRRSGDLARCAASLGQLPPRTLIREGVK